MAEELDCERCGKKTAIAVLTSTAGICRKCLKTIPNPVTVDDIRRCLLAKDRRYNSLYFESFCRRKPAQSAIPLLQQALHLGDHVISKAVAKALQKLGPNASAARKDLMAAACHTDADGMPQAYPECLRSLVAIDRTNPDLLPLIRRFMGICSWPPISAAMESLVEIETVDATNLLRELHELWYVEFDKKQKAIADRHLHDAIQKTGK